MANERINSTDRDQSRTSSTPNQTMQHEQAKGSVSGGDRQNEKGEFDKNRQEKSAIGGQSENRSETGEQGRARSELDEKSPAGQR